MRILFLSFYFRPDLCAGSFRNSVLLDQLCKVLPEGSHIDIVTTLPNRYSSYTAEAPQIEQHDRFTIHRIELPSHKSGMLDQSRSFVHFAFEAMKISRRSQYDLVYASSSRLMTASLGAFLSRLYRVPLYLDIRDIFVDTIKDVLPKKAALLLGPLFSSLEKWTFNRAKTINLVSEGFREYFEDRYPQQQLSFYPNGIDDEFKCYNAKVNQQTPASVPLVVYAGNMGEGQGLHNIIPALAKKLEGKVAFKLVGGGGRLAQLKQRIAEEQVTNVTLVEPVSRTELLRIYQDADVLFLHLNDYDAFKKVLPSKLFEYGALGKPIWAGLGGYAADFVDKYLDNAAVFNPCDVKGATESFSQLSLETTPREAFVNKFSRTQIMEEMASAILDFITNSKGIK